MNERIVIATTIDRIDASWNRVLVGKFNFSELLKVDAAETSYTAVEHPLKTAPEGRVWQLPKPSLYSDRIKLKRLRPDSTQVSSDLSAEGFRFAIVASRWNDAIVTRLIQGAQEALREMHATDESIALFRVPGSFELALCALKAAESKKFDAVICLGVIIRGETPHFDYVAAETARGINEVGLRTGVPVLFGVITANTVEQALARAGEKRDNKGYDAAMAAVEVVNLYRESFTK